MLDNIKPPTGKKAKLISKLPPFFFVGYTLLVFNFPLPPSLDIHKHTSVVFFKLKCRFNNV